MKREKTTQAKVYGMRLNPINEQENAVIGIINYWKEKGFEFKQLVMDRLLRGENYTPEMFTKEPAIAGAGYFAEKVQEMLQENSEQIGDVVARQLEGYLTRFAEELTKELTDSLKASGKYVSAVEDTDLEEEENTGIARNFAKSFMQRQQKGR